MAARKKSQDAELERAIGLLEGVSLDELSSSLAHRVIKLGADLVNKDYWADVRGIGDEILRAVKKGEIADDEELQERVHQDVDGSQRVIYTHEARLGLTATDNIDAWQDMGGENPTPEQMMFAAMERDVWDYLHANDVDDLLRGVGGDEDDD